ncbi:MAG: rhodanese-like domain-containing protein [Alphaproteobacteria bacterium]|nr:rhodanese-like domain-containing protein [Alphaproteobacteria bacterium]MDE2336479.1 rhodanese-like domain-containing protein [Alphaproteobacteria bacterium]
MTDIATIPAAETARLAAAGATILDVRQPEEHAEQRLAAEHDFVPLGALDPDDFMLRRGLDRDAPVYILCRSGMRARKAAEKFAAAGYKNPAVVEGGILACAAAGIDIASDAATQDAPQPAAAPSSKAIPLERQVRIAAGALAALGTLLGHFSLPVFYLVPFFVGCGLVYAGVTDRCGMALFLLKMPWNKSSCGSAPAACAASCAGGLPKTPGKKDAAAKDGSGTGGCA